MDIACGQETQGYVLNTQFSVFLNLKEPIQLQTRQYRQMKK